MTTYETQMLRKFLNHVLNASWKRPPSIWNDQFRIALNEGLVTHGFGGVLKLTEAGRKEAKK